MVKRNKEPKDFVEMMEQFIEQLNKLFQEMSEGEKCKK